MEEAPNKRNTVLSLANDVVLEILRRLPARSLLCYKCVCRSWNLLISDNRKVLPQTMNGFFYDGENGKRNFTSFTGERPCLSFLPFPIDKVAVLDCCNGLILCWCVEADGSCYIVCNLATQIFHVLLPSICVVAQAQLGFDHRASSSHFHVIEFVEEDAECLDVEIYSYESTAWIYKESEWGQDIDDVICSRSASVFLNCCLHIMGYALIIVVDMERKTWRKIPKPRGALPSIHQAQGQLCICIVGGVGDHNMSQLLVWILEDYATNKWTLKHTVSMLKMFAKINIQFGYVDYDSDYTAITVHLE